ncbi:MAG: hypothetical protein EB034_01475 [Verrucomicrobia bacterium]|nr:hypothetical protein [Verrucomicrobiota bacterium]
MATANLPAVPAPLPGLLGALVGCLDDRLELPVPVGNALVLQVLSAATGPAAQLVEGATAPLAAELSALVVTPPGSTVALARQALLGPLVAVQNQLWALAGEEPPSLLLSGSHTNPAEVRARQQPVVLLTAPTFDELQAALPRSFDGSVLVALDAGSFGRFLPDLQADNNGSRWRIFQQLLAGRAKVPKQGVPRREVVNVLIEAQADAPAGREFLTGLSADLSTRFLVVDAGPRPTRWPADPTLPTALAERWADLLRRVFARRGDPSPLGVKVSPEASRLFNAFHTELLAPDPLWPGRSRRSSMAGQRWPAASLSCCIWQVMTWGSRFWRPMRRRALHSPAASVARCWASTRPPNVNSGKPGSWRTGSACWPSSSSWVRWILELSTVLCRVNQRTDGGPFSKDWSRRASWSNCPAECFRSQNTSFGDS